MSRISMLLLTILVLMAFPVSGSSQNPPPAAPPAAPPLPPATRLEAFKPAAGTLVTFGYNELGSVGDVSVDAREIRGAQGTSVRGVVVEVTQSQYREERAFIDTDELDELLSGIDALLAIQSNPTGFQNFEVQYTTKGELQITAFSSRGGISYAVEAGRVTTARVFLNADNIRRLREMFAAAQTLLNTPNASR
jgi:hypothetical protein